MAAVEGNPLFSASGEAGAESRDLIRFS